MTIEIIVDAIADFISGDVPTFSICCPPHAIVNLTSVESHPIGYICLGGTDIPRSQQCPLEPGDPEVSLRIDGITKLVLRCAETLPSTAVGA